MLKKTLENEIKIEVKREKNNTKNIGIKKKSK